MVSLKRLLDLAASLVLSLLLSPLILMLAALVWWKIGRPVLFIQPRPGLAGKPFRIIKFRTMSDARGPDGRLLPDELRLGRFGRLLRSTSLDELPELINVIKGEMSLVGPRPLLMDYLPLYSPEQARRHEVRPGITGLAQVSGRNGLSWDEKFALDVWYVDHRSLWLDAKILWWTLSAAVRRHGVAQKGHVTMPRFTGSK